MRSVILWLHIAAAGTWLGANMVQLVADPIMRKTGSAVEAAWLKSTVAIGNRLYPPAAVIALITGVELVRRGGWSYGDTFVLIGLGMIAFGVVSGIGIIGPASKHLIAAVEADNDAPSARRRITLSGGVDTALVLFTMYAMVAKLGA